MKNLLLLFVIPLFFISCVRDNNDNEKNNLVSFDVSMSIPSFGVYGTDKSANSQAAKSSTFEHIFKDEIDVVFTSTTTDFTTTLTVTPNDLSSTPSIELPYGTYSWTITNDLIRTEGVDYYFPEYLPVYGSGSVEVYSSNVSLDLLVDTDYGLVTVQKENIDSVKIILGQSFEKNLILNDNLYYIYSFSSEALYLSIKENKYNTTIQTAIAETSVVKAKTHYNYILAFSDVDVNSITLKTAAFEQFDYYLQPTATLSSTCVITGSIRDIAQFNEVSFTMTASNTLPADIVFDFTTTCSETLNVVANNLPEGLTVTDYNSTFKSANLTGVVSATASGTYDYTITAFNSDNLNTATASGTVTGTIIVTGLNPIYLDENGVTIKAYEWTNVGSKGYINGVEYTIVDEATLREMVANDEDVSKIVTSKITNMRVLFNTNRQFNQDISSWDVSNVTSLYYMFQEATAFNQNIGSWDVSRVTDMRNVFTNATSFNQDLSQWNVSNVENMNALFANTPFNQDISGWDVSNVTNMGGMFGSNDFFNQPIGNWNTSNVTDMSGMFGSTSAFNQPIGNWDTSNVINMGGMFWGASVFNQDISDWDVSNVTNMNTMFYKATLFNQDLSNWCVSSIQDGTNASLTFSTDAVSWTLPKPVWGRCPSNETYVPDNNFEQALIDLGYDDVLDDYVLTSNISGVTILYVDRKKIDDLTGIEDFESLEKLYVEVNDLTSLDISHNINLTHLSANRNFLTCIKVNENQYNNVMPNLFASGDFNWSKFGWENSHNSVIYNTNCTNPDMSNVIYVTSNTDSDYTINGKDSNGDVNGLDPDLVFNVGDVIYFYVEADGNGTPHYFHIKTSPTIGTGEQIDIPSGTYKGDVIWKPEQAGTFYYQCRLHNGHGGKITIN